MKIIYASKSSGIDEIGSFQNPKYFEKPNPKAEDVIIYGAYPNIEAAYKKLGISVEVRDVPQAYLDAPKKADGKLMVGDTKANYEKLMAENAELTEQLKKERQAVKKLTDEVTDTKAILQAIEAERDALAAQLTALQAKETVAVNEVTEVDSKKVAESAAKAAKAKTETKE